eukprot:SAG31_NODE_1762_length_7323_cov_10.940753_3_plen_89_part_00
MVAWVAHNGVPEKFRSLVFRFIFVLLWSSLHRQFSMAFTCMKVPMRYLANFRYGTAPVRALGPRGAQRDGEEAWERGRRGRGPAGGDE